MDENILHSKFSINVSDKNSNIEYDIKYDDYDILHDHDYFEFVLILDGSYINYINGNEYKGITNDAYLLRPGDTHKIKKISNTECKHLNLMVSKNYFKQACDNLSSSLYDVIMTQNNIILKMNQYDSNKIMGLLKNINNSSYFDKDLYYKYALNEITYNILSQLRLFIHTAPNWLTEIQQILNSEDSLSLSVEDLVKSTHYSHTHLSRLFKQYMGVSMVKYIQEVKLDYSAKYLLYSKKSIAEISALIGYKEVSHFNHVFKAKFKMTPLQYRRYQSKDNAYKNN